MNAEEFRKAAKESIDFIVDYVENIRTRNPLPDVEQGYLHHLLPLEAPEKSESWEQIRDDFHSAIMPGVTHWSSPMFNAYFPTVPCYASILGEILAAGIGSNGFNWIAAPASAELEVIVTDWLGKLMGLPEHFLASAPGNGGGCIHSSASEGIFVSLLAAKETTIKRYQEVNPKLADADITPRLVSYASDQSNSCVEKAGKMGSVQMRLLPVDHKGSMTFATLKKAVEEDIAAGLIPCYVLATIGTTSFCAVDELEAMGPFCAANNIWLHVDAAFSGIGWICDEWRHQQRGLEWADSVNTNPHKWLAINFDCSTFWIKNRNLLIQALCVESVYLKDIEDAALKWAPEYRHWEVALGRRFRSLKLWMTLRSFGAQEVRTSIRRTCTLALCFAERLGADSRFTIFKPIIMSLVSFNLNGDSKRTRALLQEILREKKLFMVGTELHGVYYIRYSITSFTTTEDDVDLAVSIIKAAADRL